jgi:hypothetical protein
MTASGKLENVNVVLKANVYFDGKVVSHTVELKDGSVKTIGVIYPGAYSFKTGRPERMDMTAGTCNVRLAGTAEWKTYGQGTFFEVPGNSSFDIEVKNGLMEYLCSYL